MQFFIHCNDSSGAELTNLRTKRKGIVMPRHPTRHAEHYTEADAGSSNDWHEIPVDLPTTTTAEIYRIARIGERHSSTRYVVHWSPRDYTTGEPLPPEEASFQSRLMAIEYMVEVAPMAMSAPVMAIEAWLYDAEEFIASGRKLYGWVEIARFELVGTRGGDVLIEVPIEL